VSILWFEEFDHPRGATLSTAGFDDKPVAGGPGGTCTLGQTRLTEAQQLSII
jgi:hypothetical protein